MMLVDLIKQTYIFRLTDYQLNNSGAILCKVRTVINQYLLFISERLPWRYVFTTHVHDTVIEINVHLLTVIYKGT